MTKKILITGGVGFIGLHLTNRLILEGYHVDIVDNFERGVNDKFLKSALENQNVSLKILNLLNEDEVMSLDSDYYCIFHLAAIIGVVHVLNRPFEVLYDNVRMLANILKLSKEQSSNFSRLFFASTSEIYAGTLQHFDIKVPTPESTPLSVTDLSQPRTSYMLSKLYGEALCQNSGTPFTIFRPHNVYGPRMGMVHVIPEQLEKAYLAKPGDSIDVFSINHTRSFCFIEDAVEMLFLMLENKKCEGKTLNLGSQSPEITVKELVEECHNTVGKKLHISPAEAAPGSPSRRAPDMKLTKELLNYESRIGLSEGIKKTYDWYKENVFENKGISAL